MWQFSHRLFGGNSELQHFPGPFFMFIKATELQRPKATTETKDFFFSSFPNSWEVWYTFQEFKNSSGRSKRVATSLLFLWHPERRKVWDVFEGPSCPVQISENHRMLWVSLDLKDCLLPTELDMDLWGPFQTILWFYDSLMSNLSLLQGDLTPSLSYG